MTMWKKTMTWLGLDPDADYDAEGGQNFNDPALGQVEEVTPVPAGVPPTPSAPSTAPEPGITEFSAVRSLGPMSEDGDYAGEYVPDNKPLSNTSATPGLTLSTAMTHQWDR